MVTVVAVQHPSSSPEHSIPSTKCAMYRLIAQSSPNSPLFNPGGNTDPQVTINMHAHHKFMVAPCMRLTVHVKVCDASEVPNGKMKQDIVVDASGCGKCVLWEEKIRI